MSEVSLRLGPSRSPERRIVPAISEQRASQTAPYAWGEGSSASSSYAATALGGSFVLRSGLSPEGEIGSSTHSAQPLLEAVSPASPAASSNATLMPVGSVASPSPRWPSRHLSPGPSRYTSPLGKHFPNEATASEMTLSLNCASIDKQSRVFSTKAGAPAKPPHQVVLETDLERRVLFLEVDVKGQQVSIGELLWKLGQLEERLAGMGSAHQDFNVLIDDRLKACIDVLNVESAFEKIADTILGDVQAKLGKAEDKVEAISFAHGCLEKSVAKLKAECAAHSKDIDMACAGVRTTLEEHDMKLQKVQASVFSMAEQVDDMQVTCRNMQLHFGESSPEGNNLATEQPTTTISKFRCQEFDALLWESKLEALDGQLRESFQQEIRRTRDSFQKQQSDACKDLSLTSQITTSLQNEFAAVRRHIEQRHEESRQDASLLHSAVEECKRKCDAVGAAGGRYDSHGRIRHLEHNTESHTPTELVIILDALRRNFETFQVQFAAIRSEQDARTDAVEARVATVEARVEAFSLFHEQSEARVTKLEGDSHSVWATMSAICDRHSAAQKHVNDAGNLHRQLLVLDAKLKDFEFCIDSLMESDSNDGDDQRSEAMQKLESFLAQDFTRLSSLIAFYEDEASQVHFESAPRVREVRDKIIALGHSYAQVVRSLHEPGEHSMDLVVQDFKSKLAVYSKAVVEAFPV